MVWDSMFVQIRVCTKNLFIIVEHVNGFEVTAIAAVGSGGGHLHFSMGVDVYANVCVRVRA